MRKTHRDLEEEKPNDKSNDKIYLNNLDKQMAERNEISEGLKEIRLKRESMN